MTTIPTWIGILLLTLYWGVMTGMVINAYIYYNNQTIEVLS